MNHTSIVHSPFPLDYPVSTESEYLSRTREYFGGSVICTENLLPQVRKTGTERHTISQPLPVPLNSSTRYSVQPSTIQDGGFQPASGLLLSPPDSFTGSLSASGNSSSSLGFSNVPTLFQSNASSTDAYSATSLSFLPQPWSEKGMSDYKFRVTALPPPSLSPPPSLGGNQSLPTSTIGNTRSLTDSYSQGLSMNRSGSNYTYSSSHEIGRYAPAFPQTQRTTETFQFPSSGSPYHSPTNMSLEQPLRSAQRQDGPPFDETSVVHAVMNARGQQLIPDISASMQKGFFQVDHKWTCYRRNYFTVSCSFYLKNSTFEGQLYLQRQLTHQAEPISQFAVSLSAKTAALNANQESEVRALVQHTPKRDKATESVPGKVPLQPAQPPTLSNALSGSSHVYGGPQQVSSLMLDYNQNYGSAQHQSPPTSHTFERIQFQKATANNGKRRAQQQYFQIVVELSANVGRVGEPHWVKIATTQSQPMVVRGRSPGHYKDNGRRNSSASMGPDRGTGGEAGLGFGSLQSNFGSTRSQPSSMEWEPSHRGNHHLAGSYQRHHETIYTPDSSLSGDTSPGSYIDQENELRSDQVLFQSNPTEDFASESPMARGTEVYGSFDAEQNDFCRHNWDRFAFTALLPSIHL